MARCNRYKQYKACKKEISKVLIPVSYYPTRWWGLCKSEDQKKKKEKEIEPFLTEEM